MKMTMTATVEFQIEVPPEMYHPDDPKELLAEMFANPYSKIQQLIGLAQSSRHPEVSMFMDVGLQH